MSTRNENTRRITRQGVTLICRGPAQYVTEDGRFRIGRILGVFECAGPHPGCSGWQYHEREGRVWTVLNEAGDIIGDDHRTMAGAVRELAGMLSEERAR
jgi:hypothetical protein